MIGRGCKVQELQADRERSDRCSHLGVQKHGRRRIAVSDRQGLLCARRCCAHSFTLCFKQHCAMGRDSLTFKCSPECRGCRSRGLQWLHGYPVKRDFLLSACCTASVCRQAGMLTGERWNLAAVPCISSRRCGEETCCATAARGFVPNQKQHAAHPTS